MFKRLALFTLGVIVAGWAGCAIYKASQSDETKIRWLVRGMVDAFNAQEPKGCVSGLDDRFEDETTGIDRARLHDVLRYLALQDRNRKEPTFRIDVNDDEILIDVDGARATLEMDVRVQHQRNGAWTTAWEIRIEGELEDTDDGWRFVKTRHETVGGKRPF